MSEHGKMNVRQQLYKKYRLEGCSKYTSARKAGYSHAYASQAKRIEKHIDMNYWLEKEGLTDTALAKHAEEGLRAEKLQSLAFKVVSAPEWSARHKYFDTILKLRGKLSDKPIIDLSKHFSFEYKELDENTIRATQSTNESLALPSTLEGSRSRTQVRKDLIGNTRVVEEGHSKA